MRRLSFLLLFISFICFGATANNVDGLSVDENTVLIVVDEQKDNLNLDQRLHEIAKKEGIQAVVNFRSYVSDYHAESTDEQVLNYIKDSFGRDSIYFVTSHEKDCKYEFGTNVSAGFAEKEVRDYLNSVGCHFSADQQYSLMPNNKEKTSSVLSTSESSLPLIYFRTTERVVEKLNTTVIASLTRSGSDAGLAVASEVVVYSYPITAEENIDFVPFSKVVRFEAGETRVLFTFEVFESDGVADEFAIGLRYPVNAVIPDDSDASSVLKVKLYSDTVKDEFKITYPSLRYYSEGEEYTLTVSRKKIDQNQTVDYETILDGLGAEFTTSQPNFVFEPGVERMDLKFIVNDDFRFNRDLRSVTFKFKETAKITFPEGASAEFEFSDNNKAERGTFGFEFAKYVLDNNSGLPAVKIVREASTKGVASFKVLIKDEGNSFSREEVVIFNDGEFETILDLDGIPTKDAVIKMELQPLIDVVMSVQSSEIKYVDITGGDPGLGQVTVESSSLNAAENIGDYIFPLKRVGGLDYVGVVTINDAGGTAKEGVDYTLKTSTITFGIGVQAQSVQLAIKNDELFTDGKEIKLSLSSSNLKVPAKEILVKIVEDDFEKLGIVSFKVSQMSIDEEQQGVPVIITRDLPGPAVEFDISLISGTAIVGQDVQQLASQKVRFESGETEVTVYLNMIGDTVPDFDKEFSVKLSSSQSIRFGTSSMKVTVIDNEKTKAIYVKPTGQGIVAAQGQAASLNTSAGDKMLKVTLTRTVNLNESFRLFVKSADGSAKAGSHYVQVDEAFIFAQGETTKTLTLILKNAEIAGAYQDFDLNFTADSSNFIVESPALKVKISPREAMVVPGEGGSSGGAFGGLLAALLFICVGRRKAFV